MKVTYNDIASARMWAEAHAGDDNPLDVMAHKLITLIAEAAESSRDYHDRQANEARKLMSEIEARFVISGDSEF